MVVFMVVYVSIVVFGNMAVWYRAPEKPNNPGLCLGFGLWAYGVRFQA